MLNFSRALTLIKEILSYFGSKGTPILYCYEKKTEFETNLSNLNKRIFKNPNIHIHVCKAEKNN